MVGEAAVAEKHAFRGYNKLRHSVPVNSPQMQLKRFKVQIYGFLTNTSRRQPQIGGFPGIQADIHTVNPPGTIHSRERKKPKEYSTKMDDFTALPRQGVPGPDCRIMHGKVNLLHGFAFGESSGLGEERFMHMQLGLGQVGIVQKVSHCSPSVHEYRSAQECKAGATDEICTPTVCQGSRSTLNWFCLPKKLQTLHCHTIWGQKKLPGHIMIKFSFSTFKFLSICCTSSSSGLEWSEWEGNLEIVNIC